MAGTFHYTVSNNFCNVEANSIDELKTLLDDFVNDPDIETLIAEFRTATGNKYAAVTSAATTTTGSVAVAKEILGGTEIEPELETVADKWGKQFTYGHPDAPDLPGSRGKYILMEAKSKEGKAYKKWVDPLKGPKPAKPSDDGEKAPDMWVND